MASLAKGLTRAWFDKRWWLCLLWPLTVIFGAVVWTRSWFYRSGLFRRFPSSLPVIVVGNLTVGGSGKSPLVARLVTDFQVKGIKVGIVSRGYGSALAKGELREVALHDEPQCVGDEPLMLKRRLNCPVVICAERARAVAHLQTLGCEMVISDDGLQHYAMDRALELCVVDGRRGFGNGCLLPMGPMREPLSRLRRVNHVVLNGAPTEELNVLLRRFSLQSTTMCLRSRVLRRLDASAEIDLTAPGAASALLAQFADKELHAVAAIGHPERFFDTLHGLGLNCHVRGFGDHHAFVSADFDFLRRSIGPVAVLMTEKDAVKCRGLALPNAWELVVDAQFDDSLPEQLLTLLMQKGYDFKTHIH